MIQMLLFQPKCSPLDSCTFEVLNYGSWWGVKHISIRNGSIYVQYEYQEMQIKKSVCLENLRLRSRKMNVPDCISLKPGMDVCVSVVDLDEASTVAEYQKPVLKDCKIVSIERKPHEHGCRCQFFVRIYNMGGSVSRRICMGKIKDVTIKKIAILQKLKTESYGDKKHRKIFSEDCFSVCKSRLLLNRHFSSQVSCLLVVSTLKGISFNIKRIGNKIVNLIVNNESPEHGAPFENNLHQTHDGLVVFNNKAKIISFQVKDRVCKPKIEDLSHSSICKIGQEEIIRKRDTNLWIQPIDLRRSKRKKSLPDRFASHSEFFYGRHVSSEQRNLQIKIRPMIMDKSCEQYCELVLDDSPEEKMPVIRNDGCLFTQVKEDEWSCFNEIQVSFQLNLSSKNVVKNHNHEKYSVSKRKSTSEVNKSRDDILTKHVPAFQMKDKRSSYPETPASRNTPINIRLSSGMFSRGKKISDPERNSFYGTKKSHKKFIDQRESKLFMQQYIQKIESEMHEKPSSDSWDERQRKRSNPNRIFRWGTVKSDDKETLEYKDLWKEMEDSMEMLSSLGEKKRPIKETSVSLNVSTGDDRDSCQHDFKLIEDIGIICRLCSFVKTEARYVMSPFIDEPIWIKYNVHHGNGRVGEEITHGLDLCPLNHLLSVENFDSKEDYGSVWNLIPDLRTKLHPHQKEAFEFLWRNVAGTLNTKDAEYENDKIGGCVISHSPGSGKTLLVITFIVSYLKLFPQKRPLILAPKSTLCAWYEEFEKWDISLPIYQIHPLRGYRNSRRELPHGFRGKYFGNIQLTYNMRHVIDCLEKIRKWHRQPSIILMSYASFLSLTRENSNFEHKKYMSSVLKQSPGILVLDEGHNPRSTRSKLRKALMKMNTNLRILLSGTLFQNNFEEYFNTLCLARPKFVFETLKELRKKRNLHYCSDLEETKVKRNPEKLARKVFMEEIATRINSDVEEERKHGLDKLKKITSGFVNVYQGRNLDRLPGLQSYTILINPTGMQQKVLSKIQKPVTQRWYSLEQELMITLGSMHPWLATRVKSSEKYFEGSELEEIEKCKLDITKGTKVKFLVDLTSKCSTKGEKVLVFCRNILPINYLVEIFELVFGWKKGDEVLVLHGDLELYERANVMNTFKEPGNPCHVLLASTTACAEGISLVAASRVVFLDSEWNPSKTTQAIARAFRPGQEKMVFAYQLLSSGTMEEEKHGRKDWKEWISKMIFIGRCFEDSSEKKAENIDDDILRDLVEKDQDRTFHMIMKNENVFNNLV